MKHNVKITLVILALFLATQFIGLFVVNHYSQSDSELPLITDPSTQIQETSDFYKIIPSIIFALVLAITIFFLLTKYNVAIVLKIWFFLVVILALTISFTAIFNFTKYAPYIAVALALIFAILKVFRRGVISHNFSELLIYPGVAAVFVPILNVWTLIFFLLLISAYDIWAVWHSGIMQKMAKYQMDKIKVFSGFFVPYLTKRQRKNLKKLSKKELKTKKVRARVAILGGGDVVFPIISAGVMLKTLGLIPAMIVIAGATLGLSYLMFAAEKKKFYPAMPYITTGILIGIGISYLVF